MTTVDEIRRCVARCLSLGVRVEPQEHSGVEWRSYSEKWEAKYLRLPGPPRALPVNLMGAVLLSDQPDPTGGFAIDPDEPISDADEQIVVARLLGVSRGWVEGLCDGFAGTPAAQALMNADGDEYRAGLDAGYLLRHERMVICPCGQRFKAIDGDRCNTCYELAFRRAERAVLGGRA